MKTVKNIGIVFGFWFIGMIIAMGVALTLDLQSPLAESVIRDISIGVMFLLVAFYYKKPYYYLFTIVMITFAYMQISNTTTEIKNEKNESTNIQSYLKKIAQNMNLKIPMDIDKDTRIDNVQAYENTLKYYYTIKTFSKDEMNEKFYKTLETNVVISACSVASIEFYIENNVTFLYIYDDKNGVHAFDIKVTSEDCKYIQKEIKKYKK